MKLTSSTFLFSFALVSYNCIPICSANLCASCVNTTLRSGSSSLLPTWNKKKYWTWYYVFLAPKYSFIQWVQSDSKLINDLTDKLPYKCIKIWRTGKSVGPNKISNEIIKYSVPATYKAIIYIYYLIYFLTLSNIILIWEKRQGYSCKTALLSYLIIELLIGFSC